MTRAEGGYTVDGVFPFCSGITVSTHFIGGSLAPQPGGPPKHVFFCIPRETLTVLPDWGEGRFMGMQASGSNSVRLDNVFVPDRMVVDVNMMTSSEAFAAGSVGLKLHGDAMYQVVLGLLRPMTADEIAVRSGQGVAPRRRRMAARNLHDHLQEHLRRQLIAAIETRLHDPVEARLAERLVDLV